MVSVDLDDGRTHAFRAGAREVSGLSDPGDAVAEAFLEDLRVLQEEIEEGRLQPGTGLEEGRSQRESPTGTQQVTLEGEPVAETAHEAGGSRSANPNPPLGVALVGAYHGLGALVLLVVGLLGVFSGAAGGFVAGLAVLAFAGLAGWVTLGLWNLDRSAWLLALVLQGIGFLTSLVGLGSEGASAFAGMALSGLLVVYLLWVSSEFRDSASEPAGAGAEGTP